MEIYQREAEKQRLLVKKSDYAQTQLLFIVEAMKDLLADEGFSTLLRAEALEKMPRALRPVMSMSDWMAAKAQGRAAAIAQFAMGQIQEQRPEPRSAGPNRAPTAAHVWDGLSRLGRGRSVLWLDGSEEER